MQMQQPREKTQEKLAIWADSIFLFCKKMRPAKLFPCETINTSPVLHVCAKLGLTEK